MPGDGKRCLSWEKGGEFRIGQCGEGGEPANREPAACGWSQGLWGRADPQFGLSDGGKQKTYLADHVD